MNRTDHWNVDI